MNNIIEIITILYKRNLGMIRSVYIKEKHIGAKLFYTDIVFKKYT